MFCMFNKYSKAALFEMAEFWGEGVSPPEIGHFAQLPKAPPGQNWAVDLRDSGAEAGTTVLVSFWWSGRATCLTLLV